MLEGSTCLEQAHLGAIQKGPCPRAQAQPESECWKLPASPFSPPVIAQSKRASERKVEALTHCFAYPGGSDEGHHVD